MRFNAYIAFCLLYAMFVGGLLYGSASSSRSFKSLFVKTSCITPAQNPLSSDSTVNVTSLTDCVRQCLGQRGCEIALPCLGVVISEGAWTSMMCYFVLDFGGFPAEDTSKCDLDEYSLTVYKKKVSCPPGWLLYKMTCYRSGQGVQMTFADAQLACLNEGASLAQSTTVEENRFLYNLTNQNRLWIGLTLAGSGSLYKWEDGCTLSIEPIWDVGQPDNVNGQENCVEIWSTDFWNDAVCDILRDYVCQKKADEV